MRKWLKRALILMLVCGLVGCNSKTDDTTKVKIDVYVLSTCKVCQSFEENAIPALEEEFKDQLELTLYDIDDEENAKRYDEVTAKLDGYNNQYSRLVPFIVVDGYFAVLNYNLGEEVALIEDIHHALNGEELGSTLAQGRWLFKEGN